MQTTSITTPALAWIDRSSAGEPLADARPDDAVFIVTTPDGRLVGLPRENAIAQGHVKIRGRQVILTAAGHAAAQQVAASSPALPKQSRGNDKSESKPVSARMGEVASALFLARGALNIAKGPGLPAFPTAWFFTTGLNKYMGKKLLPQWLQEGPARTAIDFYIPATMLAPSLGGLRPAASTFAASVAASKAVGKGGLGSYVKAAFAPIQDAVTAGTAAGATSAKKPLPNLNLGPANKIYDLIKPLTYLGFTISSVASILGLPEHLGRKGAGGLLGSTSGRGALLGAASGATMLASLWLPRSPVQAVADAASMAFWIGELVNGEGWLDGLLGGDPKKNTNGKTAREENVPGRVNSTRR